MRLADRVAAAAVTQQPARDAEQVTQRTEGDTVEARSVSRTIRTVEDLIAHIGADMARYEIAASEATTWDGLTADRATGRPIVVALHRVFVQLKPRGGPTTREVVESMIEAASAGIRRPIVPRQRRKQTANTWAVLVVADPHFGKYAWDGTTGHGNYDLDIAARFVRHASSELLEVASRYSPGRMTVAALGDIYHYDTPGGTTTSGTPLERDGRLPKMIDDGTDAMIALIDAAANVAPADTVVVAGNHDETLTFAFQRILAERFRNDRRVAVERLFTRRKYLEHGKNLLGFTHGNKPKGGTRKLPGLMALEAAAAWARCPYREIHTGHLHNQSAEWQRPIETVDGVVVRVAPALCPPDDYHADEGFVGSRQAMELFIYDPDGGLAAMHVAGAPTSDDRPGPVRRQRRPAPRGAVPPRRVQARAGGRRADAG